MRPIGPSTSFAVTAIALTAIAGLPSEAEAADRYVCTNFLDVITCPHSLECAFNPCHASVQAAVDAAGDGDTIHLSPETFVERVVVDDAEDLVIIGSGIGETTIRGPSGNETIFVDDEDVTIRDLTIHGVYADSRRGLRVKDGHATLERVAISGGRANKGGGILATGSTLTLVDVVLMGNHSEGTGGSDGGAHLYVESSSAVVTGTTFAHGEASRDGAAIYVQNNSSSLDVQGGVFSFNAARRGGAVYAKNGRSEIRDSVFEDNSASERGGAVVIEREGVVEGSAFSRNTAPVGGALQCKDADECVLRDNVFRSNQATSRGGALHITGTDGWIVARSVLCENSAVTSGGGMQVEDADGALTNSFLLHNASQSAAGALELTAGTVSTRNNHWIGNSAVGNAGALGVVGGTLVSTSDLYWRNTGAGAAAREVGGTLELRYAWFGENTASPHNGDEEEVTLGTDPGLGAYVDGTCELALLQPTVGSPLIDAGDPDAPNDLDGTRNDIGAFGGSGALCTTDSDGDGVCDPNDICPGHPDDQDADADGLPDGCDICPGEDDTLDADGDGVPDACDGCPTQPGPTCDTGDTGDTDDTVETGDTAEPGTAEPGDTSDTGLPGDTDPEGPGDTDALDTSDGGGRAVPEVPGADAEVAPGGCGCQSAPAGGPPMMGLALLALALRRRSRG